MTSDASRPRRRRQRHGRPPLRRGGPRPPASASASSIVVFGEEPRPAYDRVHLSSLLRRRRRRPQPAPTPPGTPTNGIELRLGVQVHRARPGARRITGRRPGRCSTYERCVLATGQQPVRAPDPRHRRRRRVRVPHDRRPRGDAGLGHRRLHAPRAVVGGGLLGLEAANALRQLGLDTTVVELAPRLMAVQLDDGAGAALRRKVEALGIEVRTGVGSTAVRTSPDGRAIGLELGDEVDAARRRPRRVRGRHPPPRPAGPRRRPRHRRARRRRGRRRLRHLGPRASTPIGEVACHAGRVHGLVAPGYEMAAVAARRIAGDDAATLRPHRAGHQAEAARHRRRRGRRRATGADALVVDDPVAGTYRKLVLGADGEVTGVAARRRRRSVRVARRAWPWPSAPAPGRTRCDLLARRRPTPATPARSARATT